MDGKVKHVKFLVKLLFVNFVMISTIPSEMVLIALIVLTGTDCASTEIFRRFTT